MVDAERITELIQEIGEEDLILVFGMFAAEAERTIDSLGTGLPAPDCAKAIHFLRSGALNIGLTSLARQADEFTAATPEQAAEKSEHLMAALHRSIAQAGLPVQPGMDEAIGS